MLLHPTTPHKSLFSSPHLSSFSSSSSYINRDSFANVLDLLDDMFERASLADVRTASPFHALVTLLCIRILILPFFDFLPHSHSPSFSPSPSSSSLFLLFLCTSNIGALIHELYQAAYRRVTAKGCGSAVFPAIFKSPWGLRIHGTYRVQFYYIPYVIAGIYTVMFCTVRCDSAERNSCSTSFYEVIRCYVMCESYDMAW